jgi:hypothetical protein
VRYLIHILFLAVMLMLTAQGRAYKPRRVSSRMTTLTQPVGRRPPARYCLIHRPLRILRPRRQWPDRQERIGLARIPTAESVPGTGRPRNAPEAVSRYTIFGTRQPPPPCPGNSVLGARPRQDRPITNCCPPARTRASNRCHALLRFQQHVRTERGVHSASRPHWTETGAGTAVAPIKIQAPFGGIFEYRRLKWISQTTVL